MIFTIEYKNVSFFQVTLSTFIYQKKACQDLKQASKGSTNIKSINCSCIAELSIYTASLTPWVFLNIDTPCIYTIIIYVTALVLLQLAAKLFQKREQDS